MARTWDMIREGWGLMVTTVQTAVARIKSFFTALPDWFMDIGGRIVDGIKRGLIAKWEALKSWLSGKAKGLYKAAEDVLGMHSPSRAFMEIGTKITAGLQLGIRRNADKPLQQINALSERLRQAGAGLALGGASALAAAAPLTAPAAATAAVSGNTYNITINAPGGADAKGLAAEVERVLHRLERERAARRRSALHDIE